MTYRVPLYVNLLDFPISLHMFLCAASSILLVALLAAAAADDQCSAPAHARARARLAVTTAVNATGHWLASVLLEGDKRLPGRPGPRLHLEVEPSTRRCGVLRTDALLVTLQGFPPSPSPGYQELSGIGFYKLHEELSSWENANKVCEAEDAHLLILNSEGEVAAIQGLINRQKNPSNWFHIGFRNINGVFITIFGESLSSAGYTQWAPGEPNMDAAKCGGIAKKVGLVDIHCTDHKVQFICEQNLV